MMSNQFLFGISLFCCIIVVFCLSLFYVFSNPGELVPFERIFEGDELVHGGCV